MIKKTLKKRYNKIRKTIRKKMCKTILKGGYEEEVSIKSIFLTDPIFKAIKKLNPDFKPSGFKKEPGNQGFVLHKLNQSQNLSLPITVKKYGKDSKYYSIVDGRHRFAKLAARGNNTIRVNIIED